MLSFGNSFFELFCIWCEVWSGVWGFVFIFLFFTHIDIQFLLHHLLKILFFSISHLGTFFQKSIDHKWRDSLLNFQCFPSDQYVSVLCWYHCLGYCNFKECFEIKKCRSSSFVFPKFFGHSGSFIFAYKF